MPKMKTRRAAAKRFTETGSGQFKRNKAFKSHILEKKSPKRNENAENENPPRCGKTLYRNRLRPV